MNTIKNIAIILVAAVALAACTSGMQLEQAKTAGPGGSPFNFNLYKGYVLTSIFTKVMSACRRWSMTKAITKIPTYSPAAP